MGTPIQRGRVVLARLQRGADVREEWDRLALASENPFATPEWVDAWGRHVETDVSPSFWACRREDGSLVALLPLAVASGRRVRKLRFLGFGAADELGPVCAPADAEEAAVALEQALTLSQAEWDLFVGDVLPGDGWSRRLQGKVISTEPSPIVRLASRTWDSYLASRSARFRHELRRGERRLAESGLRFRTIDRRADVPAALDALFELHRARWGADASPWFAGFEAFHREFAEVAFDRGWLRLRVLEGTGRAPVGVSYSLRFGATEWGYQLGSDRENGSVRSAGLLLIAGTVREACAEGAAVVRLGRGGQQFKLRFATEDPGVRTVARARGVRGRVALLALERRSRPSSDG